MSDDIKLTEAEAQFADALGMEPEEYVAFKDPNYRPPGPDHDHTEAIAAERTRRVAAEQALLAAQARLDAATRKDGES
jgi:hypothetical protein